MNALKRIRIERGLTQTQLAESAGTTQGMILKYEKGERDIKKAQVITVYNIAQALGCTIEEIIKGE